MDVKYVALSSLEFPLQISLRMIPIGVPYFIYHSARQNRSHNLFSIVKCCEKNKMDNAQNGYSSVDNTGKIKKMTVFQVRKHVKLLK